MDDLLGFLYQQLRQQLEAAYAAPTWDEAHIALITSDMVNLERQLSRRNLDGAAPIGFTSAMTTGTPTADLLPRTTG